MFVFQKSDNATQQRTFPNQFEGNPDTVGCSTLPVALSLLKNMWIFRFLPSYVIYFYVEATGRLIQCSVYHYVYQHSLYCWKITQDVSFCKRKHTSWQLSEVLATSIFGISFRECIQIDGGKVPQCLAFSDFWKTTLFIKYLYFYKICLPVTLQISTLALSRKLRWLLFNRSLKSEWAGV